MVAHVNSAEGGTNGVTVTTANSGGLSGDPWSSVSIAAGTTMVFSTAAAYKGSLGYRDTYGTVSGGYTNRRRSVVGWTQFRDRWYFRFSALPSVSVQLAYVGNASGSTVLARVILLTNGKIGVQNRAGTTVFTSAASLSINTWYRVEWIVVPGTTTSNGTIRFTYAAADGAAIETYASTSANTGTSGNLGTLFVGKLAGTWNATVDWDDFAADDASNTTFLGASAASGTPVVVDPTPPPDVVAAAWPPPAPYSDAIRSSSTIAFWASATYDGAPVAGAEELAPIGGSITDTNKPGVRRVLNLELAGGHTLFDGLAPTGTELAVYCKVTYIDRLSVTFPMGVFDIDTDSLEEGAGKISLTAPDKWVRIQRAKFVQPVSATVGQSVVAQIEDLIRGALGADEPITVTATSAATMAPITWEKDRDKAIMELAEQIGAWVYFDRFGEATIADIPGAGQEARTWLADASQSGVMTSLKRERSRTDTYNVVVVESSSADSELFPTQVVWDTNTSSPTYAGTNPISAPGSAGPFGIVTEYLDSQNLSTTAEAIVAGTAHLQRGAGLSSQVSLGQVPNPAVDAFDAIDVLPPKDSLSDARVLERHVVDTVTHPLTLGPEQQIDGRQTRTDL